MKKIRYANGISKSGKVISFRRLPKLRYNSHDRKIRLYWFDERVNGRRHVVFNEYADFLHSREALYLFELGFLIPKKFELIEKRDKSGAKYFSGELVLNVEKVPGVSYVEKVICESLAKERASINMRYFAKYNDFYQFFGAYMRAGLGRDKDSAREKFHKIRAELGKE